MQGLTGFGSSVGLWQGILPEAPQGGERQGRWLPGRNRNRKRSEIEPSILQVSSLIDNVGLIKMASESMWYTLQAIQPLVDVPEPWGLLLPKDNDNNPVEDVAGISSRVLKAQVSIQNRIAHAEKEDLARLHRVSHMEENIQKQLRMIEILGAHKDKPKLWARFR
ncbi:hypothetical protein CALVIDRAFT_538894 [Calocera viscosa TUFC12733]|uniref:Uncharacterized protein n=1 Tax=Calocera viscosa (strain TUFC12733) TaxID=1330018 RepID=A0A167KAN7_CALVF|nr:hypothetical protein CALVIDRAFT_538894 [Calocera viscosa TUFC12733]